MLAAATHPCLTAMLLAVLSTYAAFRLDAAEDQGPLVLTSGETFMAGLFLALAILYTIYLLVLSVPALLMAPYPVSRKTRLLVYLAAATAAGIGIPAVPDRFAPLFPVSALLFYLADSLRLSLLNQPR
ncbi:hypothetical protein MJA45_25310 [Paenibacillus aurantius]|uniref:Uncharacterized protein n=1 Tax=Paenibacillus aurantius TaxID=2918900 RepID=A0AA96LCY1_9BACL|nr:hypothetical protein [Paenibacillus aurantius]WNQ10898.1 hypothetical protein MJA45_25310 [Paenibacillus aurantius]